MLLLNIYSLKKQRVDSLKFFSLYKLGVSNSA